jgi:hypothetical protein
VSILFSSCCTPSGPGSVWTLLLLRAAREDSQFRSEQSAPAKIPRWISFCVPPVLVSRSWFSQLANLFPLFVWKASSCRSVRFFFKVVFCVAAGDHSGLVIKSSDQSSSLLII